MAGRTRYMKAHGDTLRMSDEDAPGEIGPRPRRSFDRATPDWFTLACLGQIGDGNTMAFRRSLLTSSVRFDERIGRGRLIESGDEHVAFMSLISDGYRVSYAPDAVVRHPMPAEPSLRSAKRFRDLRSSVAYILFLWFQFPGHRIDLARFLRRALLKRVPGFGAAAPAAAGLSRFQVAGRPVRRRPHLLEGAAGMAVAQAGGRKPRQHGDAARGHAPLSACAGTSRMTGGPPMQNFWQGKRVLVTGGAGFIGSAVVAALRRRGRRRCRYRRAAIEHLRSAAAAELPRRRPKLQRRHSSRRADRRHRLQPGPPGVAVSRLHVDQPAPARSRARSGRRKGRGTRQPAGVPGQRAGAAAGRNGARRRRRRHLHGHRPVETRPAQPRGDVSRRVRVERGQRARGERLRAARSLRWRHRTRDPRHHRQMLP